MASRHTHPAGFSPAAEDGSRALADILQAASATHGSSSHAAGAAVPEREMRQDNRSSVSHQRRHSAAPEGLEQPTGAGCQPRVGVSANPPRQGGVAANVQDDRGPLQTTDAQPHPSPYPYPLPPAPADRHTPAPHDNTSTAERHPSPTHQHHAPRDPKKQQGGGPHSSEGPAATSNRERTSSRRPIPLSDVLHNKGTPGHRNYSAEYEGLEFSVADEGDGQRYAVTAWRGEGGGTDRPPLWVRALLTRDDVVRGWDTSMLSDLLVAVRNGTADTDDRFESVSDVIDGVERTVTQWKPAAELIGVPSPVNGSPPAGAPGPSSMTLAAAGGGGGGSADPPHNEPPGDKGLWAKKEPRTRKGGKTAEAGTGKAVIGKRAGHQSAMQGVHWAEKDQAWVATWYDKGDGKQKHKYFYMKHHGFDQAKALAEQHRLKMERTGRASVRRTHQSGVRGVHYHKSCNSWVASWQEAGKQKTKPFSVDQLGFEGAKEAAIRHGQKMGRLDTSEGGAERHGDQADARSADDGDDPPPVRHRRAPQLRDGGVGDGVPLHPTARRDTDRPRPRRDDRFYRNPSPAPSWLREGPPATPPTNHTASRGPRVTPVQRGHLIRHFYQQLEALGRAHPDTPLCLRFRSGSALTQLAVEVVLPGTPVQSVPLSAATREAMGAAIDAAWACRQQEMDIDGTEDQQPVTHAQRMVLCRVYGQCDGEDIKEAASRFIKQLLKTNRQHTRLGYEAAMDAATRHKRALMEQRHSPFERGAPPWSGSDSSGSHEGRNGSQRNKQRRMDEEDGGLSPASDRCDLGGLTGDALGRGLMRRLRQEQPNVHSLCLNNGGVGVSWRATYVFEGYFWDSQAAATVDLCQFSVGEDVTSREAILTAFRQAVEYRNALHSSRLGDQGVLIDLSWLEEAQRGAAGDGNSPLAGHGSIPPPLDKRDPMPPRIEPKGRRGRPLDESSSAPGRAADALPIGAPGPSCMPPAAAGGWVAEPPHNEPRRHKGLSAKRRHGHRPQSTVSGERVTESAGPADEESAVDRSPSPKPRHTHPLGSCPPAHDGAPTPNAREGRYQSDVRGVRWAERDKAWRVSWYEKGDRKYKDFFVGEHGFDKAKALAEQHRLKMERTGRAAVKKRSEHQSDVKGVRYNESSNSWVATWREGGKEKWRSFSIDKLGYDGALGAAIAERRALESQRRTSEGGAKSDKGRPCSPPNDDGAIHSARRHGPPSCGPHMGGMKGGDLAAALVDVLSSDGSCGLCWQDGSFRVRVPSSVGEGATERIVDVPVVDLSSRSAVVAAFRRAVEELSRLSTVSTGEAAVPLDISWLDDISPDGCNRPRTRRRSGARRKPMPAPSLSEGPSDHTPDSNDPMAPHIQPGRRHRGRSAHRVSERLMADPFGPESGEPSHRPGSRRDSQDELLPPPIRPTSEAHRRREGEELPHRPGAKRRRDRSGGGKERHVSAKLSEGSGHALAASLVEQARRQLTDVNRGDADSFGLEWDAEEASFVACRRDGEAKHDERVFSVPDVTSSRLILRASAQAAHHRNATAGDGATMVDVRRINLHPQPTDKHDADKGTSAGAASKGPTHHDGGGADVGGVGGGDDMDWADDVSSRDGQPRHKAGKGNTVIRKPAEHQSDVTGVSYEETKKTWRADWLEGGKRKYKPFYVREHGFDTAKALAEQHRREMQRTGQAATKKRSKHQSGVRGVNFEKTQKRWVAKWQVGGKTKTKYFSVAELGYEPAKQAAIAHRRAMEERRSTPLGSDSQPVHQPPSLHHSAAGHGRPEASRPQPSPPAAQENDIDMRGGSMASSRHLDQQDSCPGGGAIMIDVQRINLHPQQQLQNRETGKGTSDGTASKRPKHHGRV
ncbi:unnamed protein product [Vitrella brassicaformis CCMP3155]|uniref:AP2/ERF domain-containing protein n=1 Tax=Vitrella brassicaformis (strain CCMP3155) TaxID=1169540 RepID=A0A0G4ELU5_VITBC|nr:unnamed protein product [Vitrella brassicaformis CCMP3155]|eukprot:CEL98398.1 unnamed protein product [Vitrella brassicaformis CCMP3155]